MKSCSRPTWLSFVREHFPHLLDDYNRRFATADFVDPAYRNRMATLTRQICRKHHLHERNAEAHLTHDTSLPHSTSNQSVNIQSANNQSANPSTTNQATTNQSPGNQFSGTQSATNPSGRKQPTPRKPPTPIRPENPQPSLFATR